MWPPSSRIQLHEAAPPSARRPSRHRGTPSRADRTLNAAFPGLRLRRTRRTAWSRRLVAEHRLGVADLIWPLFVIEGTNKRVPVATMPGVERLSIDNVVAAPRRRCVSASRPLRSFPTPSRSCAPKDAREAFNPDNLVCRATRAIKDAGLDIGVILDVALDPYTSHGHDGLMRGAEIANDETLEALVRQSLVQADAGADILAPSDMMDGRVGAIRTRARGNGHAEHADHGVRRQVCLGVLRPVPRCSRLSVTLASSQGVGDKRTYQMDPANSDEALREVALDLAEGADMVMVKPGLAYLDIVRRVAGDVPRADVRLPGVGRVRDAAGRGRSTVARRRRRDDGEPARLQARRRCGRPHLLSPRAPRHSSTLAALAAHAAARRVGDLSSVLRRLRPVRGVAGHSAAAARSRPWASGSR